MFTRIPVKREMVLLHVLNGMHASHAYATVYGQNLSKAVCEASASRLLSDAKVQARKAELLAAKAAAEPIGVPFLTGELIAISAEARALGQGSAAVQAMMGVAKLHGLLVDKVQADVLVRKPSASPESPDDLSAEEWLNQYASAKLIEQKAPDEEEQNIEPSNDGLDGGALLDKT